MSIVAQERCGWRDEKISRRHRLWGVSCPAIDLDFLMLEFNYREPVALVEYKHMKAPVTGFGMGRYEALRKLCDGFHREQDGTYIHAPLACLVARYDDSDWSFIVTPLNDKARTHYAHCGERVISEQRFVKSLLLLRKQVLSAEDEAVIEQLNTDE